VILQRPKCLVAKCWHFLLVRKVDCRSTEIETRSGHLASTWVRPSCMHCWLISPLLSVSWGSKPGWYKFLRMPSRPNRAEKAHHHCSQAKNHHRSPTPKTLGFHPAPSNGLCQVLKIRFARNFTLRGNRRSTFLEFKYGYHTSACHSHGLVSIKKADQRYRNTLTRSYQQTSLMWQAPETRFLPSPKSQGYGPGQAEGVFVVSTCGSPT